MNLGLRYSNRFYPGAVALAALVGTGFLLLACRSEAAPRIVAVQGTIGFGQRDAEEVVTNRFMLRNAGDAPLIIGAIRTSCGCTRAEPERRQLQPGEEAGLDVRLALHGLQGLLRKSLAVDSNDPETPTLTLWMEGESCAAVYLDPMKVSFGRVEPLEPPPPVTVRMAGYATNVTITAATSDNPVFAVSVDPGGRALTLAPPKLNAPGAHRGLVHVTFSDPGKPSVGLHLYAWMDDVLRVVPSALAFRPGGEPASTRLVIVRPGTASRFKITQARIDGGDGQAEVLARPDGSYQIAVQRVIPDTLATNATLLIRTDLPERPEWRVPLRLEGHAP